MQLTLQTGLSGRSLMRPVTVNRATTALIAGAAVAAACLVAVGPAASPSLPRVQRHEVQLVDVWENPIDPATVLPDALDNIQNIQTAIGNVPLNDVLTDLLSGYGDRLSLAFDRSADAFQELIETYPATLQTSLDFLADGQFVEAYSELNSFGLFGLEDLAAPLYALVSSNRGGEGILNDLAQQTYNVINALSTRGEINGFAEAFLAPNLTANFEAALIADNITDAFNSGDYNSAFNDLINAPSQILGAYLNGADFPFGNEAFPGILSPEGPFQLLFVTIPTQIANAIDAPAAAASAEALDVGDWSALLGGDWSALFDGGSLSALFDAGDWGALFTDSVTSAVDPGAVSDGLTSLMTSLL